MLGRRLPEPIQLSNRNHRDNIKSFLVTTASIFCRLLGVGLPPEEKILAGVDLRIAKEKPTQLPSNRAQQQKHWVMVLAQITNKFTKTKDHLKQIFTSAGKDASNPLNFPRMVSEITFSSRAKDNRQEILNFVMSATSLRCGTFHLPTVQKLKLERMIFEPKLKINSVGSVAAGLAMLELIKYFVVAF